jgi:exodeoxyribonuclease V alpha subunit
MSENIEGYVDHVIYRNDDNGYTVLSLDAAGGQIACVGNFPYISDGIYLALEGEYTTHAVYGRQFRINNWSEKTPDDIKSVERYLSSGAIRGIGEKMAKNIVKKFGSDTFRIFSEEPERLAEIKGISERMAVAFASQFLEKQNMRRAMMFLQKYGISPNLSAKIFKKYGDGMYDIINSNPYRLADDIDGVGFKKSDEIAANVGIPVNSEYRIQAGIMYVLSLAVLNGNTCYPCDQLLSEAAAILTVEIEEAEHAYSDLVFEHKVITIKNPDRDMVFPANYYYKELNTARMLVDLNTHFNADKAKIEAFFKHVEETGILNTNQAKNTGGIKLDGLQKEAVTAAAENGILILTGGPGTGKTTTINAIIKYFEEQGMEILCAAPTGRAAKRMKEATGYEAKTIHRLLEINKQPGSENPMKNDAGADFMFSRNRDNPLETDVIIIDETSMVDINLMYSLLSAIQVGTHIVFAGDVNQLPSVGPGAVLADMIKSDCFKVVRLEHIFRQAAESDIIVNAHRINEGDEIKCDNKSRDFFLLENNRPQEIVAMIITLIKDKLPKYISAASNEIQVLTPMRKGNLGVENLNLQLQEYLNPKSDSRNEKEAHGVLFREGDKVMQVKNDYNIEWEIRSSRGFLSESGIGVFNGDCGEIRQINDFAQTVEVEFEDGRCVSYPYQALDELEPAYAITVHKSQGSEYPAVIIPLLDGPKILFSRNILYTAVTRARKCVVIVGSKKTVDYMIANAGEQKRYTDLCEKITAFTNNNLPL